MCQLNSFSGIENFWKGFTENRRPAWFPQTWSFTFTWDPQKTYPHDLSSSSPLMCRTQDRLNLPFLYSGGAAHLRFRPMSGNSCRSFSWRSARRAMFLSLMLIGVGLLSVAAELPRLEQPAKNDGSLSLLVVGDWGRRGGYNQSKVAAQVRELSSLFNPFSLYFYLEFLSNALNNSSSQLLPLYSSLFLLIGISRDGGSADLKGRKEVEYPSMIHISL